MIQITRETYNTILTYVGIGALGLVIGYFIAFLLEIKNEQNTLRTILVIIISIIICEAITYIGMRLDNLIIII